MVLGGQSILGSMFTASFADGNVSLANLVCVLARLEDDDGKPVNDSTAVSKVHHSAWGSPKVTPISGCQCLYAVIDSSRSCTADTVTSTKEFMSVGNGAPSPVVDG